MHNMPPRSSQRLLFYFLLPLCYYSRLSSGQETYKPRSPSCSVTNNYTVGSTYESNLVQLLDQLPKSAMQNAGFANDTVGLPPDQVFGLAMCYADSDRFECAACLNQVAASIVSICPYSTTVSACADACVLQYAIAPFSAATLTWQYASWSIAYNVSDTASLALVREQLIKRLIGGIAQSAPALAVAGNRTFNSTKTMYGLVQCTRDLTVRECERCLNNYVTKLQDLFPRSPAGWLYGPSCYMRYSLTTFDVTIPALGAAPAPLPSGQTHTDGSEKRKILTITVVTIGSVLALLLLVLVVTLARRAWMTPPPVPRPNQGPHQVASPPVMTPRAPLGLRKFNLRELKAATNKFTTMIGQGEFGLVYRGALPNGQVIAVKELKMGDRINNRFEKESEILGALRHKNIVELVGYSHEKGRYMLCCEFVAGGNLEEHLFGGMARLDWPTRFNIVKGVCSGLVYLHDESNRCTVHLDLKPSNILLHKDSNGGNMEPKISDFGISRFLDASTREYKATHGIVGPYGYMAPEYHTNGIVSPKADVYSFGIVILEMVTGQRSCTFWRDNALPDRFIDYVRRKWDDGKGNLNELRDQILEDKYSIPEVRRCIETALLCVQNNPADRPDAKKIERRIFDDGLV